MDLVAVTIVSLVEVVVIMVAEVTEGDMGEGGTIITEEGEVATTTGGTEQWPRGLSYYAYHILLYCKS